MNRAGRGAGAPSGLTAPFRALGPLARLVVVAGGASVVAGATACDDASVTVDGFPIALPARGGTPAGGLVARRGMGADDLMAIDTGSPLTFVRGQADGVAHMTRRSFDILGAIPGKNGYPLRASFQHIQVLPVSLDPAGPDIVLGADVLRGFSLQIDFGVPALTMWSGQRAPDSFLGAAQCGGTPASPTCFATLHFNLVGGGELTAVSEPDFLGLTGPVEFSATRLILRTCAAPWNASPPTDQQETPLCCTRSAAVNLPTAASPLQFGYAPTGTDLALVVATGLGPTVLAESAWNTIVTNWNRIPGAEPLPAPQPGPPVSFPSLPDPVTNVMWAELPRLALVDLESDPSTNPGSCVELARARRLEWVERRRAEGMEAFAQLCDTDLREPTKAQNAAGYVEMGGNVKVAIIPDGTAVLQTVRAELRQQGPQIDGFLGTDVLAETMMEIDYGASPARVVFSCQPGVARASCLASPRCARQASPGDVHSCFGLPPLPLPERKTSPAETCVPSEGV